jgi:hypothetical protein
MAADGWRDDSWLEDRLAPRVIATTASPAKRAITVMRSDARTDRYALHRFPDGSVWWRGDSFTAPEHPREPERWVAYRGELTVSEVLSLLPGHAREVLAWTRTEIENGPDVLEADDPDVRDRRARSLERLRGELEAVYASASSSAGAR